jgi:phage protein D
MPLGISIAVAGTADDQMSDATMVEVQQRMGERTTYKLRYDIDITGDDIPALSDARSDPGSLLSVLVPVNGANVCLVKGPVTAHQINFVHGGAGSYLEVQGTDTTIAMDRETKTVLWPDVTDSDAVNTILGQYGYTPDLDPTDASHPENKHSLVQRDSDWRFVKRLARRNGILFWVDSDETGTETAHFKKPVVAGDPAMNLDINLDTSQIDSLTLNWDVERPSSVVASQVNLNDKSAIDGAVAQTPLAPLGGTALSAIATGVRSVPVTAPVDDVGDLQARGQSALIEAGWFIRAACQTSLKALNDIMKPNTLVNLRGMGTRHSGNYYVAAVKHVITPDGHTMDVELIRNAWGAAS